MILLLRTMSQFSQLFTFHTVFGVWKRELGMFMVQVVEYCLVLVWAVAVGLGL